MSANEQLTNHEDLIDVIIGEHPEKGVQYRLSVTEFRDEKYLSIREWYADYDNKFSPSNNGFTVLYGLSTVSSLFHALKTLLSQAETLETVRLDETFIETLFRKAQFTDRISKETGIPAELLHNYIHSVDALEDNVTITIKVPRGSEWLKK